MRSDKYPTYEERFAAFSKSIEKGIVILVVALAISLLLVQGLLQIDSFRHWFIEVDRLEGIAS